MLFAIIKSYENNTLISEEAAAWCTSASEDDVYCFREGEIEMIRLY